ncbi:multidrug resistance-associated protein 1-like isoform X2 [Harmonia axyridis]|uniref:multidrug resistance-associated protein 1-like isoform X2 n=1 Tax=Harmonia axyridis TaxID=115357 RepID=UPI001E27748E|nr:multidrug resistance-associated protein 1-like isoform X2 [Harmonia axyridis]
MVYTWLDDYCGSAFWNESITWNTNQPNFTDCFEETISIWIPSLFLWLFSGLEIYYYCNSSKRKIPWNLLNSMKTVIALVLCFLVAVKGILSMNDEADTHIYIEDYMTPIIEFSTLVLVMVHIDMNRRKGFGTSGILFIYWLLCVICDTSTIYSTIHRWDKSVYQKWMNIVHFILSLSEFFLNCFADRSAFHVGNISWKVCPEEYSSFLSRILFSWLTPLAWKGYKSTLQNSDIWYLRKEEMCENVYPKFNKYWNSSQKKCEGKQTSILPSLIKCFGMKNLMAAFLKFIQDSLMFVSPLVLRLIIEFVGKDEALWKGVLYASILFVACSLQTIFLSQYFYKMFTIGIQMRAALISAIYRKSLRITGFSRKENTVGEIVNLMSVDTQYFVDILTYLNLIWSAPYQIIVSLYLLWQTLGISVIAGVGMLIVMIPINTVIINRVKKFQINQMKHKDDRIRVTNEMLSGIKILKLYAWEPFFEDSIQGIRLKELFEMRRAAFMNAGSNFIWTCAPFLTSVSLRRINEFMNSPELDINNVTHEPRSDFPLIMKNGKFSWGCQPVLQDINIHLSKGSLVAVVGQVGAGKSSLISAFLGEMEKCHGQVNTFGSVAYVSQQTWIQNDTIKNNILFGRKYNEKLYTSVLEACALKEDLKILPGGDLTEIGEKGINLSGGQKQRVNLARAVYAMRDIYFLDDPLSAVDSHVSKHIFEHVIGPNGLLRNKTRLLSTHCINFLHLTDLILVLKNGSISERGGYEELLSSKGAFAEFLEQHCKNPSQDQNDDKELINATRDSTEFVNNTELEVSEKETSHYSDLVIKSDKSSRNNSFRVRPSFENNSGQLTETEKIEIGRVSFQVYKNYIISIGPLLCFGILIFNLIYQTFGVASSFWLSKWSNDDSAENTSVRNKYIGIYGLLGLGQGLASFLLTFAFAQGFYMSSIKAHQNLIKSCLHAAQSFYDTTPTGRILNRFSNDLNCMDNTLPMSVYQAVTTFFVLFGTLFVISYNFPIFLILIVLTATVFFFIQRIYQSTCRQLKRMESVSRSPIFSFFGETLTGASTIRAFLQNERFIAESDKKLDNNQAHYFYGLVANRWLAVRLESIANIIILFSALFCVFEKDRLSTGIVGLSVTYALQITQTLNWLVRMICDVETNIIAIERIKDYSELPQETLWVIPDTEPESDWPKNGCIIFQDYSVRYRPGLDLVLTKINLKIDEKERIGIVGRTGAGKSSLTLCLFRIIEAAGGSILIDGIDISKLGLHTLRSKITIIPQDAVLFSGTLRMNLDPFNKYTDEEIWSTLEHAHLKEFIAGCSKGLQYEVNEGGENFSLGQRQLICLCRALLRKTKLLILDEATAAVDYGTDSFIQETIRTQFRDCTIITIAHRLNTVIDYDRIIVLDKGSIKEVDSPHNLMKQNGIFYGMCREAGIL